MKVINAGQPIVIMPWSEFENLLKQIPKDNWRHYMIAAGFDRKELEENLLLPERELLRKLFIEMEENL